MIIYEKISSKSKPSDHLNVIIVIAKMGLM